MHRMELLWRDKHPTAKLDMKQLNNQRYSIMRKHLLSALELEELSRLAEHDDPVGGTPRDAGGPAAETHIGDSAAGSPVVVGDLPADIQDLRQKIMDCLPTEQGQRSYLPKLRYEITDTILAQINLALGTIPTTNITETNALIYATVMVLQDIAGKSRSTQPRISHNAWQQRLERKIKRLRSDVSRLSEVAKGKVIRNQDRLRRRYGNAPVTIALETAKQRLVALSARLKRYNEEAEARNINRLFSTDASKVYTSLRSGTSCDKHPDPPKKETEMFWKGIWEKEASHNEQAQWIAGLKADHQTSVHQQPQVTISEDDLRRRVNRMKNWTAPGPDMIHTYWLKKLTSLHRRLACQMEKLVAEGDHPSWLTQGRTVLVMKDPQQGSIPSNYRPITCLSTTWKLLSGIIADKIQDHMDGYMHQAQKGIGGGSRGSKHQLLIDQAVAKDSRSRRTNLAMAWIDYKKAYDSIPHSWILECLRLYKINPRLVAFIRQSMKHWRTTLSANSTNIAEVTIKCGIYQGDALSPLLFCIALNPLSALLDKSTYGYRFKSGTTINHLLYMDDIKLYAKNEQDIDSLIHLTRVFSADIGMTFGLAKCGRLIVSRGKVKNTSGINLPGGRIDDIDESYKYLGILQSFGNNDEEVRCKAISEYRNRVRRVLKSKLSSKNKVAAINTFAVPVIRYPAAMVTWRQEDVKAADIGTRKLLTMHGVFHPKSSTARLYTSRREGGRGLHSIEKVVRQEEQSLKSYVCWKAENDPLMAECKRLIAAWKEPDESPAWYEKPLHGAWHKAVSETADMAMTYQWLTKSNIRTNTEALIMAAQEQALNTRAVAFEIYHTVQDPRCRMCRQHPETVAHLVSGCSKLVGTEYTQRHNHVASVVYRAISAEYDLQHSKDWWVEPESVVKNDRAKILWDFPIQTDRHMPHNRPDIVLIDYQQQSGLIIDIAVPRDENIRDKELEKIDKYQSLKIELEQLWKVKITVIPIVVGALGAMAERLS